MRRRTRRAGARFTVNGIMLMALGIVPAVAADYYVSPSGSDSNSGTQSSPFRTINFASARLRAGDTLFVRGGTYYERPTISVSGTASAPITIEGMPGETAVVDPGGSEFRTAGNNDWELVNASLGEWRSVKSFSSGNIYGFVKGIPGYANERVGLVPYESAAAFRSTSETYVDGSTPFYVGPGTYHDSDARIHIRLTKTADLKRAEARYGEVFPVDNPDPRNYGIVISNSSTTMRVSGSYLTFRNLTFHQSTQTIMLSSGVHDLTFDGITGWLGDSVIAVGGSGVHHVTIVNSRLYGDVPPWIAWSDAKSSPAPADLWRGCTINLSDGAHDFRIAYNHLRGGHDGVGVNDAEYNVVVDHNRIESFHDDCFELEGTTSVGRIEVYENYIGSCLVAIAPGQDTPSFPGPLLVYRNVIVLLENPYVNRKEGINSWNGGGRYGSEYMFKHGSGSSYSTRNAHYYHNTMVMLSTDGNGINITPKYPDDGRIANNLMIMVNGVVNGSYRTASGLVWDGDIYWKINTVDSDHLVSSYDTVSSFSSSTGFERNGQGSVTRRGTNPKFAIFNPQFVDRTRSFWELLPQFERPKPSDFMLASDSPAIGAGIVIPPHPVLGTMPDTRSSRDVGAIPFGTPASQYDIFPFVPGGQPSSGDITPPTVSILSPASGAVLTSATTVTANASDNVGVVGVQFRLDGTALGSEDTAAPYSVPWDVSTATSGAHTVSAVARDAAGNTRVASASVTVTGPDLTQPTVSISSPSGGASVAGTVTVTASASDNVGVAGVQFLLDGASLGSEDTASPWSVSWNTGGVPNGSHTVSAVARDAAGNSRTSSTISVNVNNADTTQPNVSLTAPATGSEISGSVSLSATASDNVGVAGVTFRVDGAVVGSEDTSSPYGVLWDTTGVVNGSHSLTATARDAAGNTRVSSSVSVQVDNGDTVQPTVSLVAPSSGASLGGTITLSASASDNVGVVGVQFTVDGGNAGSEDLSAPWSTTFDTTQTANGTHTVSAVARDAAGNRRIAPSVTISITNLDQTSPSVTLTTPASGVSVAGSVTLAASASDNVAVAGVQFQVDGVNVGGEVTIEPYTIQWDTTGLSGSHTLRAVARDPAGNRATSPGVTVDVNANDKTAPRAPSGVRAHGKPPKKD